MNPFTLHQSRVIREIYGELGRAGEAEGRVERWYRARATMGPPGTEPHLLVRDLKQYAREKIYKDVFDDDKRVVAMYESKEVAGFGKGDHVEGALALMRQKGVNAAIVSESGSVIAAQTVSRYLKAHALD